MAAEFIDETKQLIHLRCIVGGRRELVAAAGSAGIAEVNEDRSYRPALGFINCWTQKGHYSMTPATRCLPGRPLSTVRRTDRLWRHCRRWCRFALIASCYSLGDALTPAATCRLVLRTTSKPPHPR